ncbi:MAG: DUF420 domain-containing protein [Chitinophagales bacterium]|nr:DUF420 domain-containing protein [Bacteroidota bacterium]MBK8681453.1 DUF420 domain-containing protein [Bacteroidota bacterium]
MNERSVSKWIIIISIAVPALIAFLFYSPVVHLNVDVSFLPKFHAFLNSCVFILLLSGYYFIRHNKIRQHKYCMISAFSLSGLFLISYVFYHAATESTKYGGEGIIKYIYYFILLTHIVLAALVLPFILITLSRALSQRFDKHKRIARITLPIWLYVSFTGVIVYFMISPYYA